MPKQIKTISLYIGNAISDGSSALAEIGMEHPNRIAVYVTMVNVTDITDITFYVLGSPDGSAKHRIYFSSTANDYWGKKITSPAASTIALVLPLPPFIGNWIGIEWDVTVGAEPEMVILVKAVIEKYSRPEMRGVV